MKTVNIMSKYRRYDNENGSLISVQKQTPEGILEVYNDSIIHLDTSISFDRYFNEGLGYKPTTKKVFDKMYKEALERIKKLHS